MGPSMCDVMDCGYPPTRAHFSPWNRISGLKSRRKKGPEARSSAIKARDSARTRDRVFFSKKPEGPAVGGGESRCRHIYLYHQAENERREKSAGRWQNEGNIEYKVYTPTPHPPNALFAQAADRAPSKERWRDNGTMIHDRPRGCAEKIAFTLGSYY